MIRTSPLKTRVKNFCVLRKVQHNFRDSQDLRQGQSPAYMARCHVFCGGPYKLVMGSIEIYNSAKNSSCSNLCALWSRFRISCSETMHLPNEIFFRHGVGTSRVWHNCWPVWIVCWFCAWYTHKQWNAVTETDVLVEMPGFEYLTWRISIQCKIMVLNPRCAHRHGVFSIFMLIFGDGNILNIC